MTVAATMRTTQGQSLSTIDKERSLGAMVDMNMQIVRRSCPHKMYYHFDLNAGCGWNEECGGVPGSPLVFVALAERYLRRWRALFFEIDYDRATELERCLRGVPHCRVEFADNSAFLGRALAMTKASDVGSVLADPNGWLYRRADNGWGCPVTQMASFFYERPRIDLIANLNLRFYKQAKGAQLRHPLHPDYSQLPRLPDMRSLFHKRHGLISKRSNNGHTDFVRIVLRNLRTNDYKAEGWHFLDSPVAKEIYRYAESFRADGVEEQQKLDFGT